MRRFVSKIKQVKRIHTHPCKVVSRPLDKHHWGKVWTSQRVVDLTVPIFSSWASFSSSSSLHRLTIVDQPPTICRQRQLWTLTCCRAFPSYLILHIIILLRIHDICRSSIPVNTRLWRFLEYLLYAILVGYFCGGRWHVLCGCVNQIWCCLVTKPFQCLLGWRFKLAHWAWCISFLGESLLQAFLQETYVFKQLEVRFFISQISSFAPISNIFPSKNFYHYDEASASLLCKPIQPQAFDMKTMGGLEHWESEIAKVFKKNGQWMSLNMPAQLERRLKTRRCPPWR